MTKTDEKLILFDNPRARKHQYWVCVKMIAPSDCAEPLGGWTADHCIGLYCEKCKEKMTYQVGNSKIVIRHMETTHPILLYAAKQEELELADTKPPATTNYINPSPTKLQTNN